MIIPDIRAHDAEGVNHPGSYFESVYVEKGIGVDGYETMIDAAIMKRAFMTSSEYTWGVGWSLYNPDADLYNDEIIEMMDFYVFSCYWGVNYQYFPYTAFPDTTKVKVIGPEAPVSVGEQFNVDIAIFDVVGLNAHEFTLAWNSSLLTIISVVEGGFTSESGASASIIGTSYLYFGFVADHKEVFGGSGVLATIAFECIGTGETTLDLSSRLININLMPMPHQDEGCTVLCLALEEHTQALIDIIKAWDLPAGTETSLTSKLKDVLTLLDKGNENGAVHKLMDFISQVEAFRGKKLTNEQADLLIAEAQNTINIIEQ
jgi:hypothetical protein